MPSELFTTSYLGSYAGLVAVTYLLVQFFKEPIRQHLSDWWIRLLAVFIAFGIQLFTLYVTNTATAEPIGLAVLNSFLIAITAAGMHDVSQSSTTPLPTVPISATGSYGPNGVNIALLNGSTPAASKTLPESENDPPPNPGSQY